MGVLKKSSGTNFETVPMSSPVYINDQQCKVVKSSNCTINSACLIFALCSKTIVELELWNDVYMLRGEECRSYISWQRCDFEDVD